MHRHVEGIKFHLAEFEGVSYYFDKKKTTPLCVGRGEEALTVQACAKAFKHQL